MSEDYASSSSRAASPVGELPNIPVTRQYRFTWDAAHRRPGPGSVSETTEGRGDYYGQSMSFDLPPTPNLPLGAVPPYWSSAVHGFHAISTVLNNPHKKQAPPKAHSSLPTVPPADLPRVRRKDFDAYLKSVGPEWERFEKNMELGREGAAQISGPSTSDSSLSISSSGDIPQTPRTPRPPAGKPLPPLESVPELYFDSNFTLGDPRTFNAVTEHHDQQAGFLLDDPASFSYAQPIIDKLSVHADTIEQHLVREISLRSTSFFAALSNLQDLQTESERCLDRIANLRKLLKEVDEKGAKKGLEVVRLESKLRNLGSVKDGVKVVGGVIEMTNVAKSLVTAGQWGEALDVVDELQALWDAGVERPPDVPQIPVSPPPVPNKDGRFTPLPVVPESPPASPPQEPSRPKPITPLVPISSLLAFSELPSHLRTLTLDIAASLSSEVVNILRADLMERIDVDGASSGGGQRMSLKDRLRPLLQSLVRTGGIREAILSWREVVLLEVRNILKRRIPAFALEDDGATSTAAQELRSLDQSAFIDLAQVMYKGFLNCIEGLQAQNTIAIEVIEAIQQPKSPVDVTALREDLSDILASAGELAHACAAKVIIVRSEQHTALDLQSFWTFFTVSWDFVVKSEVICRRMIVGLRGAVMGQAKTFLQAFHQTRLSQSAKLVEDEQWSPAEVPPTVQHTVNLLVDASIQDPVELMFNPPADEPAPAQPEAPTTPSPALAINGAPVQPSSPVPSPSIPAHIPNHVQNQAKRRSAHGPSKHLKIEDRHFFAVSATLEVLVLLSDYLRVIINLPMLVTDTMSRIIELLKAFNSRTCQVVLGAGAMRSAGLKNITAKHLALASQSLSIMISLIPYVRETFRRHLSQKQAVMLIEFDKLKRDYQEHQNEIHAKLIAIMGDRLSVHIRSLQAVRWDIPKEGGGVNDYIELLVKETVTLHKVLSRYLSVSVVEYVMTQVFAAVNHRLSEEFGNIDLPSLEAKERLLADAKYLHEKLSGLKNVRAPTAMLEIVVQEKRIEVKPPPTPIQTPHSTTTHLRFAHMFSRGDSLKVHRATTPVPSPPVDTEKALPAPSSSPDPPSVHRTDSAPTPPVTNGHDRALSPVPNGNGKITPDDLVEEPESTDDASPYDGSTLSPIPVRADLAPDHPGSRAGSRAGSRPSSPHSGSRPGSRPGSRVSSPQPLLPSEIMRAQREGKLEEVEQMELVPEP